MRRNILCLLILFAFVPAPAPVSAFSPDYVNGLYYEELFEDYADYADFKAKNDANAAANSLGANSAAFNSASLSFPSESGGRYGRLEPLNQTGAAYQYTAIQSVTGQFAVEFDFRDDGYAPGWINFYAKFAGQPAPTQIMGVNSSGRGTLLRYPSSSSGAGNAPRWLFINGEKYLPPAGEWQNMKFLFDLDDAKTVQTFVNGRKAAFKNETGTADESDATTFSGNSEFDWKTMTHIGFGVQVDGLPAAGAVGFDNIRAYHPADYPVSLIQLLPAHMDAGDAGAAETAALARKMVDAAKLYGVGETRITNLSTLLTWEKVLFGALFWSEAYEIDDDARTISGVAAGEKVSAALARLSRVPNAALSIKRGATVLGDNDGIIDGDVLAVSQNGVHAADYRINALPPSAENALVSAGAYNLSDAAVSDVAYGTALSAFKQQLTLPAYAYANYPLDDGERVYDGMLFTVTAQNGGVRAYIVSVNPGRSGGALRSSGYVVDSVQRTVSGVALGQNIAPFLAATSATEGASYRLLTADMQPVTSGAFKGGETIRLYQEQPPYPGAFEIYAVLFDETAGTTTQERVVTISPSQNKNGDSVELTGAWDESGGAVEPGYNGMTSIYGGADANARFTPNIAVAGKYKVYVYTSYHSSNPTRDAEIYADGVRLSARVPINFAAPSGWKYAGEYDFTEGSKGYLQFTAALLARISAVRFAMEETVGVASASVSVNGTETPLAPRGGIAGIEAGDARITLRFSYPMNESGFTKTNLRLVTENGYDVAYTGVYSAAGRAYALTTDYALANGAAYYLIVSDGLTTEAGDRLSSVYVFPFQTRERGLYCAARTTYEDEDGRPSVSAANAARVCARYSLTNRTAETKNVQLIAAYYENGALTRLSIESQTATAESVLSGSFSFDLRSPSDAVRVYVWNDAFVPLAETYAEGGM
jgi:hypothetical protein